MVTCPSCRRLASRVTNCRRRSTAKLRNSAACSSFVSTGDSFSWWGCRWQRAQRGWPPAPSHQLGAPAEVVPAYASSLAGLAVASLPCPLTSHQVARFIAVCRTSTRAEMLRLSSLVLLAVIGGDLGLQRTPEPVNPRLNLRGRVAILMREHRTEVGQQVEYNPHGPGEGHPLSGKAVMEELGERLKDRLALVEVGRGLVGQALRRERHEGRGGPPRPRQTFEVRQQVRHPRLQCAWWRIHLRTDQGDERPTGDEGG